MKQKTSEEYEQEIANLKWLIEVKDIAIGKLSDRADYFESKCRQLQRATSKER